MNVLSVLNAPWAIVPEKYAQIRDIYVRHVNGEHVDIAALEAEMGRKLENTRNDHYEIVNGVAVLPVLGVIAQRMNLFAEISGGTSNQVLAKDFADALGNPEVHSILLVIDSPGGEVNGTQEFTNQVFAARGVKPLVALCEGMMASAAYWIGSAADEVFISSDTVQVGSIGVVASHTDLSRAEQMRGVKVTEISAGKYKRIVSQHEPLSAEGRDLLQSEVDYIYSVFVNDIARNRARTVDKVLAEMAEGRTFLGRQAITAGLADDLATTGDIIRELGRWRQSKLISNRSAVAAPKGQPAMDEPKTLVISGTAMSAETIEAAIKKSFDEGFLAGGKTERERIVAVEQQMLPGHAALINEMKYDGTTTGAGAAQRVLAAERAKLGRRAEELHADAPPAAPHSASDRATATGQARPSLDANATEEEVADAAKQEWAASAPLHREFTSEACYVAFKKAEARGQIRILTKRTA